MEGLPVYNISLTNISLLFYFPEVIIVIRIVIRLNHLVQISKQNYISLPELQIILPFLKFLFKH